MKESLPGSTYADINGALNDAQTNIASVQPAQTDITLEQSVYSAAQKDFQAAKLNSWLN